MRELIVIFISVLTMLTATSCSTQEQTQADYWSDINARVEDYIWEREDTKDIPASYYELCVHMMQEVQRQMNEHGDSESFDYKWEYTDASWLGIQTISLTVTTELDEHAITVLIDGY